MMSKVSSIVSTCSGIDCPLKASVKRPTTIKNIADLCRKNKRAQVRQIDGTDLRDCTSNSNERSCDLYSLITIKIERRKLISRCKRDAH